MRGNSLTHDEIADLNARFSEASPEEVLAWARERFGSRVMLATGFGREGMILVEAIAQAAPDLGIFTLDTGRLHEETHEFMERVRSRYGIRIELFFPEREAVEQMVRDHGPRSFRQGIAERRECCAVRKLAPLRRALGGLDAWVTGLRRAQSPTRSDCRNVEYDERNGLIKINPLAHWRDSEVLDRIRERSIPTHPLLSRGYASIGCAPCTRRVAPGDHPRAGRWWWERSKHPECGLHA